VELLTSILFLRSLQLIFIILAGIICVIVGYKLFLYGVDKGRSKLRFKSEIYRLLFSGSGPGLIFMVLGGLIVIYSIYSIGITSDLLQYNKGLAGNAEASSKPLTQEIEADAVTIENEDLSEASIVGIPSKSSANVNRDKVKPKSSRQIKSSLSTNKLASGRLKPAYRSQEELSRIINQHNKAIEYCYKKEVKSNPSLKGDMDVEFIIEYNGRVKEVRIVRSSIYSKKIEKCVSTRIKGWRFKTIGQHEGDVKVRQKYIFG
jgi:hypothetical protein